MEKVDIQWMKSIKDAVKFGIRPRRFLPYFIIDLVAVIIGLLYLFFNANTVMQYSAGLEAESMIPEGIISLLIPFVIILAVWYLVKVFIDAAVMRQSVNPKPKEYKKSWIEAKNIYPQFLGTAIVIGLVTSLLSLVPYLGDLLALIAALFLFFALPFVAVDKKGVREAIDKSIKIFKKRWGYIIGCWLTILAVSVVIVLVFAIPFLILFSEAITQFISTGAVDTEVMLYAIQNVHLLVICGLIFGVGLAIVSSVKVNLLVSFYKKLKKV